MRRPAPRALALLAFAPLGATIATWLALVVQAPDARVRVTPTFGVIAWDSDHFAFEDRSPAVDADPAIAAHSADISHQGDIAAIPHVSVSTFLDFTYAAGHTADAPGGHPEYRLLLVPFWWPALVTTLLPAWWLRARWLRVTRTSAGLCRFCGYDLRASPGRCPECGSPAQPPNPAAV